LHSAGSGGRGSWPDWYCEIGFEEIAVDLPQARFWIISGLPTTLPEESVTQRNLSPKGVAVEANMNRAQARRKLRPSRPVVSRRPRGA
jgi:hypothetical protein